MDREAPHLHALVMAAGAGSRFGGGKLRAVWRGEPMIASAVRAACASPARSVAVVTGADEDVAALASAASTRELSIVHAPDWREGLAASLRAGWRTAPESAQGVFVFLGDMPETPPGMAARLIQPWLDGADASAPEFDGRRGHPVLVGRSLWPAVRALTGDAGLNAVLGGSGVRLALVATQDVGVVRDVDTRAALDAYA